MAELVLKAPSPWVQTAGRISYRFRQHLQIVLLAVCLLLPRPLGSERAELLLLLTSSLLVLAGGGLRSWAMGYHTWRRQHGGRPERTLVTAGPYAHIRNPLYLGSFLLGCGLASMSGWLAVLGGFAALFLASHYCIIRWEEGRMAEEFGGSFNAYAASVPRFFPGLRSAATRTGSFSFPVMMKCLEPAKTVGAVIVLLLMAYLRMRGWTLAG
jgi:protein-S-isoprenylcysteine O-methyltransferase Ste14